MTIALTCLYKTSLKPLPHQTQSIIILSINHHSLSWEYRISYICYSLHVLNFVSDYFISPFYIAVTRLDPSVTILMFSACEKKSCVNVSIESFNVNLERMPGLDRRITLHPVEGLLEDVYIPHIGKKPKHISWYI